mmetsp:Transcript_42609/g.72677  ORF Transcript_42609/g.72677 Transcript_42609/m.72677 type:complete len:350 (-) Transcript_42609:129-1178(-)|eukprot:CAMPEP_0183763486 /NCGR_PEP_ID=MMETSP0739-20130205/9731_1 /TAXON_ID=385413 /ORGANISM="Thalassiosira miniscula, Strain CCMP1093" /LENGTH=349 /DNA_ID=CAMNT_0026001913 /DNA_START=149 /DNA_END=1198 /DNA_ORIENTATION=-
MTKPFNVGIHRPRWRNLLIARALLFAISIVLSSSGEDVEPYDTTERNLLAPRLVRRSGATIAEPPMGRNQRELDSSKAAKSKSSKMGSKSGSKSAKSKSSKVGSKSGSKGSKSKSAKSVATKASGSKSVKSQYSAKSKAEKGKSEKSLSSSRKSGDSVQTKSVDGMDVEGDAENVSVSESEDNVAANPLSVKSTPEYQVSNNHDHMSPEELEEVANSRSGFTESSTDAVEHNGVDAPVENENVIETSTLEGDAVEDSNSSNLESQDSVNESSPNAINNSFEEKVNSSESTSTEVIGVSSDTLEDEENYKSSVDAPTFEAELNEERIEKSQNENLDVDEVILDASLETLE